MFPIRSHFSAIGVATLRSTVAQNAPYSVTFRITVSLHVAHDKSMLPIRLHCSIVAHAPNLSH